LEEAKMSDRERLVHGDSELGATPLVRKKVWVPPAIVHQDVVEVVAGACTGANSKAPGQAGCGINGGMLNS
jgi:hypothetical protein